MKCPHNLSKHLWEMLTCTNYVDREGNRTPKLVFRGADGGKKVLKIQRNSIAHSICFFFES